MNIGRETGRRFGCMGQRAGVQFRLRFGGRVRVSVRVSGKQASAEHETNGARKSPLPPPLLFIRIRYVCFVNEVH